MERKNPFFFWWVRASVREYSGQVFRTISAIWTLGMNFKERTNPRSQDSMFQSFSAEGPDLKPGALGVPPSLPWPCLLLSRRPGTTPKTELSCTCRGTKAFRVRSCQSAREDTAKSLCGTVPFTKGRPSLLDFVSSDSFPLSPHSATEI